MRDKEYRQRIEKEGDKKNKIRSPTKKNNMKRDKEKTRKVQSNNKIKEQTTSGKGKPNNKKRRNGRLKKGKLQDNIKKKFPRLWKGGCNENSSNMQEGVTKEGNLPHDGHEEEIIDQSFN